MQMKMSVKYFQGKISVNQANVTASDDVSVNGIIHVIDQILFPPDVDKDNILLIPVSTSHFRLINRSMTIGRGMMFFLLNVSPVGLKRSEPDRCC